MNLTFLFYLQLQANMTADGVARKRSIVDPAVRGACCHESLKTVIEICIRCLSKEPTDRPSVEDVLWNLQFAAQVQDAWRGDSQSSEGSSMVPSPSNNIHYWDILWAWWVLVYLSCARTGLAFSSGPCFCLDGNVNTVLLGTCQSCKEM